MASGRIRTDYDQLKEISNMFNAQAEGYRGTNQRLKSNIETLKGGDWIGEGARAFYREMDSEVMPALQRLQNAMAEAAKITGQIARVMKQAEDDASNCFKL